MLFSKSPIFSKQSCRIEQQNGKQPPFHMGGQRENAPNNYSTLFPHSSRFFQATLQNVGLQAADVEGRKSADLQVQKRICCNPGKSKLTVLSTTLLLLFPIVFHTNSIAMHADIQQDSAHTLFQGAFDYCLSFL